MIATTNAEECEISRASSSGIAAPEGTCTSSSLEVKVPAGTYGIGGHMVMLETPPQLT
jgi:hypothetical protein